MCLSVQNTTFFQRADGGVTSPWVTTLAYVYTPSQRSGEGYTGIAMAVRPSVRLSMDKFRPELFSYSFARTALKFIYNVCVHMKLCMCNFHDHTIIGCGIISPSTCKFYWIIVVQRNNPTVLHVLNSKLHTMLLVVHSFACAFSLPYCHWLLNYLPLNLQILWRQRYPYSGWNEM